MEINATFVGQAVAFLIFAVLCMKYVWPPLLNAIEKRQKEIADGLTAAEKAKKSLELAKEDAAETVRSAKAEAQRIIEEANKTRSQIIKQLSERSLTLIVLLLVTLIPLPLASLYTIPAKIILAYLGCRLVVGGSINTLVVDHEGNSLVLGVSFTRVGFELVNPELFVRRTDDGKLVRVELPAVPRELYAISRDDLEDFAHNEPTLQELKDEVMMNNAR